jgi:hypothetical protein
VTEGDEPEEQRRQELLKVFFESFKHFTTLAVTAAVVLLAVYREGIADQTLLAIALGMFRLAVLFAVLGMSQVLDSRPLQNGRGARTSTQGNDRYSNFAVRRGSAVRPIKSARRSSHDGVCGLRLV